MVTQGWGQGWGDAAKPSREGWGMSGGPHFPLSVSAPHDPCPPSPFSSSKLGTFLPTIPYAPQSLPLPSTVLPAIPTAPFKTVCSRAQASP